MKTRNGLFKSLFVLVCFLVPIIWPMTVPLRQNFLYAIMGPLVVGLLLVISRVYMRRRMLGEEPQSPRWSEAVFNFGDPLKLIRFLPIAQLLGLSLIALGAGLLLGTYLKFQAIQAFGVGSMGMGIGLLGGIQLSLIRKV